MNKKYPDQRCASYHQQSYTSENIGQELSFCCQQGWMKYVRYLLTTPTLSRKVDIHYNDDVALRVACSYGQFEVVEYLLTSPELKDHANIHFWNDYIMDAACRGLSLDMIKFLLTSPKLKKHPNFYAHNGSAFYELVRNTPNDKNLDLKNEILNYLILDYRIEYNEYIKKHLAYDRKDLIVMFERRDLVQSLNEDLKDNTDKNSIKKSKL